MKVYIWGLTIYFILLTILSPKDFNIFSTSIFFEISLSTVRKTAPKLATGPVNEDAMSINRS